MVKLNVKTFGSIKEYFKLILFRLFTLALIFLTNEINNTLYDYQICDRFINQLFYIDDLQLFLKSDNKYESFLTTITKSVMISP